MSGLADGLIIVATTKTTAMENKDLRKEQSNEDQLANYDPTDRNFDHTEVSGDPHVDDPRDQRVPDEESNQRTDRPGKARQKE